MTWLFAVSYITLGYLIRPRLNWERIIAFLRRAVGLGSAAAIYNLYFYIGPIAIWFARPNAEMGAFSAAFRPINPVLALPWLLTLPMLPVLAHLARVEPARFRDQAAYLIPMFVGLGTLAAVLGREFAFDILQLLYGDRYVTGELSAVSTFQNLSLAFGFALATPVLATLLLADGKENVLLPMALTGLAVNVALNVILLPARGFVGAASATVATEVCVFVFAIFVTTRLSIYRFSLFVLCKFLLPAAGLAVLLSIAPDRSGFRFVMAAFGVLVATVAIFRMRSVRDGRRALDEHAAKRSRSIDDRRIQES